MINKKLLFFYFISLFFITFFFIGQKFFTPKQALAQSAVFQAATARVEITPTALGFPSYYRAGYGGSAPVTITSGSPLYATGLILVNSAGQRWIMISADIDSFPTSVVNDIQATAMSQFNIPPERILLTSTHTHSGPVLVDQPNVYITYNIAPGSSADQLVQSYTNAFKTRINNLVSSLVSAPTTDVNGSFGYGSSNIGYNRSSVRTAVTDGNVPVMTLRSVSTSKIVAIVFSYAAHAVSKGQITAWNPDYPGATVNLVQSQLSTANPGIRVFYLPGAAGDQNPTGTSDAIAAMLATQITTVAANSSGTGSAPVYEPELAGHQDVMLPLDIRVDDTVISSYYNGLLASLPSSADRRHAEVITNQLNNGTLKRNITERITVWRFGTPAGTKPLALISLAGEPTVDYGIGFDYILGNNYRPWTIGYTNGDPSYLPSDEVLSRGDGCPASDCFYNRYESGWGVLVGSQRYPQGSATTYNDGLVTPLAALTDNKVCEIATTLLQGVASDCTNFTPGRVIPHPTLANAGTALASWTDSDNRARLELLVLGTNGCINHRSWTGNSNGSLTGVWSAWSPTSICDATAPPSADAWVDSAGNMHIELVTRLTDGSFYHYRCSGDSNGCFNRPWTSVIIARANDGFLETPELSVWKQQDGKMRINAYAVRGTNRCMIHLPWTSTDTLGNGSWADIWSAPKCSLIVGPVAAATWRTSTNIVHDVFVRTNDNRLFTTRCLGTDSSCSWSLWVQLTKPAGATIVDAPAFSVASTATGGQRSDLFVRDSGNCIWQASWTSTTVPTSPAWHKLWGCGLSSRVAAVNWQDNFGRNRTSIASVDRTANGPLWIRGLVSRTGATSNDIELIWEDIADKDAAISTP